MLNVPNSIVCGQGSEYWCLYAIDGVLCAPGKQAPSYRQRKRRPACRTLKHTHMRVPHRPHTHICRNITTTATTTTTTTQTFNQTTDNAVSIKPFSRIVKADVDLCKFGVRVYATARRYLPACSYRDITNIYIYLTYSCVRVVEICKQRFFLIQAHADAASAGCDVVVFDSFWVCTYHIFYLTSAGWMNVCACMCKA